MRGARAKDLRQQAYGDISLKVKREMERFITTFRHVNKIDSITGKPIEEKKISFFNKRHSPRSVYLLLKRAYKHRVSFSWLYQ